jgi:hypothetical protein
MGRHPHARTFELALKEETEVARQEGDNGRSLMLRPGECGGVARLVVVLEKADELVLVVEAGSQMVADRPDMALFQAVVEPLVVAVVETLLLSVHSRFQ